MTDIFNRARRSVLFGASALAAFFAKTSSGAVTPSPVSSGKQQYFYKGTSKPLAGGKIYTYAAGTNTPKTTYQNASRTVPNMNPVVLDSSGSALIFWSGSYKVVVVDSAGNTVYTVDNYMTDQTAALQAQLADISGAGLVGFTQGRSGAVSRTAQAKLLEIPSAKDYGAKVDGSTDDTNAIANARASVASGGGTILYGAKTAAKGFWENLTPLAMEWIKGSPTAYATDVVSSKPLVGGKLFNATPAVGPGYAGYGFRMDSYTKGGLDVASTATGMFSMQAYSTNSSGKNSNNTNQVALVAHSSAMDANSSAPITAVNAITHSSYSGSVAQQIVGIEVDVSVTNPVGWYGEAGKAYTVGCSVVLGSGADGTVAYGAGTSSGAHAWWHGMVLSGMSHTGLTIARDGTRVPETGVWIAGAATYGIYVGAKDKHRLNPGSIASYTYRPVIGIALGQEGAASAKSHKVRFISADRAGAEYATDLYTGPGGNLMLDFGGTNKFSIVSVDGSIYINGTKVLGNRETGWGANTGTTSKAGFDTGTVTLAQLAQTVAALQQALKNHGVIGT